MAQLLIRKNVAWVEVSAAAGALGGGTPVDFLEPTQFNKGPTGSSPETINGDVNLNTPGATLTNKLITGTLTLSAGSTAATDVEALGGVGISGGASKAGMTLTRVKGPTINSNGFKDLAIYDSVFAGAANTQISQLAYYDSVQKALVEGGCDGLKVHNSFFGAPGPHTTGETHLEAMHLMGVSNAQFVNTTFDFRPPNVLTWDFTTGAFTMEAGPYSRDILIDGCHFYGGSYYQMYIVGERVTFRNNKLHSFTMPGRATTSAQYPPSTYNRWWPITQSGNTLDGVPFALENPGAR